MDPQVQSLSSFEPAWVDLSRGTIDSLPFGLRLANVLFFFMISECVPFSASEVRDLKH